MDRLDFVQRYKLISRAAAAAGYRLKEEDIAWTVFGTKTNEVPPVCRQIAKTKFSQRKNGSRRFQDDLMPSLVQAVNQQTNGLFNCIPQDAFVGPLEAFQRRLINAALLIEGQTAPDPPLCERLSEIKDTHGVVDLLKQKDHTFTWSQEFKEAFNLVPDHRERLVHLFCHAIEECTYLRGRQHVLMLAAGTLTDAWGELEGLAELRKLTARLEKQMDGFEPRFVFIAEPLSYIRALHGEAGAFVANIERMIRDRKWRRTDFRERLHYYGTIPENPVTDVRARKVLVARNIARHLETTITGSDILCQDVGRFIELYRELSKLRPHRRLMDFIKEGTLKRLANVGISSALRGEAEDLMEGREANKMFAKSSG
ncbi:MAG: hypothetical protein JWP25_2203 [Bradyrhizobium sp.]|nr:hypothetical protein [Bradyrhizobium sp.]